MVGSFGGGGPATATEERVTPPTPIIVFKIVTAVPTDTPVPTQTPYIIYRYIRPTAVPTDTPAATPTPIVGVIKDGSCWFFNLYGVNAVHVDGTPVAPAYGNVRVCGQRVVIE